MELKIENEKLILDTSFTMKDYMETKIFLIEDLYEKNNQNYIQRKKCIKPRSFSR